MLKKVCRYLFFLLITCTLVLHGPGGIKANAETYVEPTIRIGVIPEAEESILIGSQGDYQVIDKVTGEVLFDGQNDQVTVKLAATSILHTNYRLQVSWTTNNAFIADWLNRAAIAGYSTYVEPYNNGYRLYIGEFEASASWSVRNTFRNKVISEGLAGSDSFWKIVTYTEGEAQLRLVSELDTKVTSSPVRIISSTNLVKIGNRNYRGIGEVGFNTKGTLAGINELPLEQYLYGVVPNELPPNPYGAIEAQKAQAIAARTYALRGMGKRKADGYDLLPTVSDQVYNGYETEQLISSTAVDETRGVVATYNGNLIDAVFNSTCGGYSANNEDVWNSAAEPYLRGVPDGERGEAFLHVPTLEVFKNHSNPTSLRAEKEGDYDSDWSKYHRWTCEWTADQMSQILSSYFSTSVGKVNEINVAERSDSGRVLTIEFVTENGNYKEYKDKVRWALQYYNANGILSVLRSTLFYIEPVINPSTKEVLGFKAYGGGWGHGIGLCQTGAVGMAEKGYTCEEILKHYYQGIALETRY